MGRIYSFSFLAVGATALQDVFEVLAAAGVSFCVHRVSLTQSSDYGDAQAEGLPVRIKRATAGYTTGSGGSSVAAGSAAKHNTRDSACAASAKLNNTTQALAGGGTIVPIISESFNEQGGYEYLPIPEDRIWFHGGEACIVSVQANPADSITLDGTITIEEA